jgi:hypothetical protein
MIVNEFLLSKVEFSVLGNAAGTMPLEFLPYQPWLWLAAGSMLGSPNR